MKPLTTIAAAILAIAMWVAAAADEYCAAACSSLRTRSGRLIR